MNIDELIAAYETLPEEEKRLLDEERYFGATRAQARMRDYIASVMPDLRETFRAMSLSDSLQETVRRSRADALSAFRAFDPPFEPLSKSLMASFFDVDRSAVKDFLSAFGRADLGAFRPSIDGSMLRSSEGLAKATILDFATLTQGFSTSGIVDDLLRGMREDAKRLFADAISSAFAAEPHEEATEDERADAERQRIVAFDAGILLLMDRIAADPRVRFEMEWRDLEKIVYEIFVAEGYENVELTSASKDGGLDVVGTLRLPHGRMVVGAQCKHSSKYTVKPDVLQALFGVVIDRRLDQGVLFATNRAQPAAWRFANRQSPMISIVADEALAERIRMARTPRSWRSGG